MDFEGCSNITERQPRAVELFGNIHLPVVECAIRLKPDTEYGRIRTRNTDESGHPIRGKADT